MEVAPLSHIKQELKHQSPARLIELCLHMAKFSKDNKEMLNYLLFETGNEEQYRQDIKQEITEMFEYVDHYSVYFAKKTLRKNTSVFKKAHGLHHFQTHRGGAADTLLPGNAGTSGSIIVSSCCL
jgi:hypothetical protein